MLKLLIGGMVASAAISFSTAIPTIAIPIAGADYPCKHGGPGTDGNGGPNCQACVVNTPAAMSAAVCFGQGVGAMPGS